MKQLAHHQVEIINTLPHEVHEPTAIYLAKVSVQVYLFVDDLDQIAQSVPMVAKNSPSRHDQ